MTPDSLEARTRGLAIQAALDAWFLLSLGATSLLTAHMPVRDNDADFNENYERDRRYVERYAAHLRLVRTALVERDEAARLGLGLATRLDFDPCHNLRGASPLDALRDRIVEAFRALRHAARRQASSGGDETADGLPTLAALGLHAFGPADEQRLTQAVRDFAAGGVDAAGQLASLAALRTSLAPVLDGRTRTALARLERLLASGLDQASPAAIDHGQWDALLTWAAVEDERPPVSRGRWPWSSRRLDPGPPDVRAALASLYCALGLLVGPDGLTVRRPAC